MSDNLNKHGEKENKNKKKTWLSLWFPFYPQQSGTGYPQKRRQIQACPNRCSSRRLKQFQVSFLLAVISLARSPSPVPFLTISFLVGRVPLLK